MTIIQDLLVKPGGSTPWANAQVTVAPAAAFFLDDGTEIRASSSDLTDATGLVSFTLPPTPDGFFFWWTYPDGAPRPFSVPASGTHWLKDCLTSPTLPPGITGLLTKAEADSDYAPVDGSLNYVGTDAQTLTSGQKSQARTNLGLGATGSGVFSVQSVAPDGAGNVDLSGSFTEPHEAIDVLLTSPAADPTYVLGGTAADSGPAFAAAYLAAQSAQAADPLGVSNNGKRGRKAIRIPAGSYYTAQGICMMSTSGGNRAQGLPYLGAGKGLTQIVFDPGNGNPRTFADAATTSGSSTVTSATANFTSADKGRRFVVYQAGPGGGTLDTIIVSVTNSTTVVIGVTASVTVTGADAEVTPECALFYDGDKWAGVTVQGIEFIALQPGSAPPTKVIQSGQLGRTVADGAMTNGSATLTSGTANFTLDDLGLTVTVAGAGAAGATLTATIASVNSAANVTLSAAASTTVAGASVSVLSNWLRVDRTVADGAITTGTTTLTSATAAFTSADLGSTVGVAAAGAGAGLLRASIQKIISGTQVQLSLAASATVSGATTAIAGPALSGKHIGSQFTIAGAGAAGAALTATVLLIVNENTSNGTEVCKVKLSVAASTVVANAQVTIRRAATAIFMRSTSNGGITGQSYRECVWRGAWAHINLLDGNNQDADFSWTDPEVYDRPGTFLHLLPDPAFLVSGGSDQQLDYNFRGGIWAPLYGDFINFDGRGGHITLAGGSETVGTSIATTADTGGTLPVALNGDLNDPGGTWFRTRDRSAIRNKRVLLVERARFEERNHNTLISDIEWSLGQVTFINCADDSTHATAATDRFSRIGFLDVAGPTVQYIGCTWKGMHEIRFSALTWRKPHSISYRGCHLIDALSAKDFIAYTGTDGAPNLASLKPMVRFEGGTKVSTALTSATSYQDQADTELNWAGSPHGVALRKRARFSGGSNSGLPGPNTSTAMTVKLPFGVHVLGFRLFRQAVGSSTDITWQIVIKDGGGTTLATFAPGSGGVPAGTQWQAAGDWTVAPSPPGGLPSWVCTSANNRTLTATLTGAATNSDTAAILEVDYVG